MHKTINLCIYVNASEKHESMKEKETAEKQNVKTVSMFTIPVTLEVCNYLVTAELKKY